MVTQLVDFLKFVGKEFNAVTVTHSYSEEIEVEYIKRGANYLHDHSYSLEEIVTEYLKHKVNGNT